MNTVLYHNHIPRTSGTDILYELQRAAKSSNGAAKMYTPGILEFAFDREKTKNFNIISGHFASNPVREIDDVLTFMIVRNPVDQYISTAAYRCLTDGIEFTSEYLDRFIDGEFDIFGAFQGFSGCENPQSKFIAGKLVEFSYDDSGVDQSYVFIDEPLDISSAKSFIDNSIVGSLENRSLAIEKLNSFLLSRFGVKISANTQRTNTTVSPTFLVSDDQLKRMKKKLELDEEIYQYVKKIEKRQNA